MQYIGFCTNILVLKIFVPSPHNLTEDQREAWLNSCKEIMKKFKFGTAEPVKTPLQMKKKHGYVRMSQKLNNNLLFVYLQMNRIIRKLSIQEVHIKEK